MNEIAVRPRIMLRTHYQADEPRLIIAVVTRCSRATQSGDEDRAALCLREWAKRNGFEISLPGAVYAVGNARHLGLITNSHHWTASGIAVSFVDRVWPAPRGATTRHLSPVEQRVYLNVYLQGAGALAIKFAKWLVERGEVNDDDLRKERVIEKLLVTALEEYLALATDVAERATLRREKERIERAHYEASTKRHKRYPLLKTLERLELLEQADSNHARIIFPDKEGRLRAVAGAVPNVQTLERLIRENTLQQTLDLAMHEYMRTDLSTGIHPKALLSQAYVYGMDLGLQACPLSFLDQVLGAAFPASPKRASPTAMSVIEPISLARAGEVRFHVDRRGRRAFVILSKAALCSLVT